MIKPMLHKLTALVGKLRKGAAAPAPQPYDLTREQLSALITLRTYEEWQSFLALIDSDCAYKCETLVYENDVARNAFLRGQIAALRDLPMIIERLALTDHDAKQRRIERDATAQHDKRTSSLYGTPSWPAGQRGSVPRSDRV